MKHIFIINYSKTAKKYPEAVIARSSSDEAISTSKYRLRSLSRVFEGPARHVRNSISNVASNDTMIYILLCITFAPILFILPPRVNAFSECRSEKKGYCLRLDAQDAPKSIIQKKSSSLFFAATAGAPFPGLEFLQTYGIGYDTKIGELLSALYNFGVVIAGISALIMFTYGGVRYLTSAGSSSAISDARQKMTSALIGLALIAGSYLILYTINPDFTLTLSEDRIPSLNLKPKTVAPTPVPELGPPQ